MLSKRILVLMFLVLFLPLVGCQTPSNQAPIITSDQIITATVGVEYVYDVNATDPDGDTLIYSLAVKPGGMTINSATGLIKWTPVTAQIGDNSVTVKVSDGTLSITQNFTIVVEALPAVNQAPIIISTPITVATVGVGYVYEVKAFDPEGDTLTYSLTTKPSGMAIGSSTGKITWTPSSIGSFGVTVKVSDGVLSDTQSFTIVVSGLPVVNQAPVITSTPVTTATVGVEYVYDVNATDPDGDVLTYSLTTKPNGMVINSANGLISWVPTSVQTGYNWVVIVSVSDGTLSDFQGFNIVVSGLPVVNQAPVITSTPVTTATVGVTYVYDVNATDPDGDTLTYSLTVKPTGMIISPTNGLIWWTPTSKGSYAVVMEVSDGVLSDAQSFTIVVSEPIVPPETYTITASAGPGGSISPLGDVTVDEGSDRLFTITPNTNYNIADVLVDGGSVGAVSTYTFNNVAKDHTIHATFSAVEPEVELTRIEVSPDTMTLFEGGSQLITSVTAHYSDGSTTDIALGSCTYASSATAVATVSNGLVTAVAEGTATITVSYMSKTDTLGVTVNPVLLTSIAVLPEAMTLSVKGSGAITSVTAHYNDGSTAVVVLGDCTYLSDDEAVATVLAGVVSALTPGTATITVNCGGMTDTVEVTVSSILLTSIVVLPETMTLLSTGTEIITSVTAHYSDGSTKDIDRLTCDYESAHPSIATVNPHSPWVYAKGCGTTTITVSYTEEEIIKTVFVEETDTVGVTVGPVHNITRKTYHDTIQDAINGAVDFDTIEVAAGTYNERLTINESLDLIGSPNNESVITLAGLPLQNPNILIEIPGGVSNVSVTGFTLVGSPTFNYSDETVVRCYANNDNITIEDNIINGYFGVIYKGPGQDLTVHSNHFTVNKSGVTCQPGGGSNVTISDNVFTIGSSPLNQSGSGVYGHTTRFNS